MEGARSVGASRRWETAPPRVALPYLPFSFIERRFDVIFLIIR